MSCPQSGVELGDEFRPVVRTGQYRQPSVVDRDDRLSDLLWGSATSRAGDTAGGAVFEQRDVTVDREVTERAEPLRVVVAADERDGEPLGDEKRDTVPAGRPERGPTGGTPDRPVVDLLRRSERRFRVHLGIWG